MSKEMMINVQSLIYFFRVESFFLLNDNNEITYTDYGESYSRSY